MSYTKGPWSVGNKQSHGTPVSGPMGVSVAWCGVAMTVSRSGSYDIGTDEASANAGLIAAAPDMADALKAVLADYGIRCGPHDALRPIGAQPMSIRQVMMALAKAGAA